MTSDPGMQTRHVGMGRKTSCVGSMNGVANFIRHLMHLGITVDVIVFSIRVGSSTLRL